MGSGIEPNYEAIGEIARLFNLAARDLGTAVEFEAIDYPVTRVLYQWRRDVAVAYERLGETAMETQLRRDLVQGFAHYEAMRDQCAERGRFIPWQAAWRRLRDGIRVVDQAVPAVTAAAVRGRRFVEELQRFYAGGKFIFPVGMALIVGASLAWSVGHLSSSNSA